MRLKYFKWMSLLEFGWADCTVYDAVEQITHLSDKNVQLYIIILPSNKVPEKKRKTKT